MKTTRSAEVASAHRVGELDLLRFLAALAVVLYHYTFRGFSTGDMSTMPYPLLVPVTKYGNLGVELFFMISGFVILMSASSGSLRKFATSRVARLYPMFWACCTLTFIVTLLLGGAYFSVSAPQYAVNLTMLSGFLDVPSVDGVYWSLFVELRFYALVALVLLFRQLERTQLLLALWLIASVVLEFAPLPLLGFLLITDYSPLFIAGAFCFLIRSRGVTFARLGLVGAAWTVALYHALGDIPKLEAKYHTQLSPYVVGGVISVFFVVLIAVALRRTGRLAAINWVTLGALTYPLYLIHQNIGYMIFNAAYPTVNPHVLLWGTVLGMLVLAYLLDRAIEQRYARAFKGFLEGRLTAVLAALPLDRLGQLSFPARAHSKPHHGLKRKLD